MAPNYYIMENLSIPFWAEDDRPREKMMLKGRSVLSNAELLAIIIGSGTRKKSAVEVAQEILSSNNNKIKNLSKRNLNELCKFDGIGEAKAITIMAAMELARRRESEAENKTIQITCSNDAYQFIKAKLADLDHEEAYIILLTRRNTVISFELISRGGKDYCSIDQRIIFEKALTAKASSIILVHNHPSGQLKPSTSDNKLTKIVYDCGKLISIPLIDHIIYTDRGYYSYMDSGNLNF